MQFFRPFFLGLLVLLGHVSINTAASLEDFRRLLVAPRVPADKDIEAQSRINETQEVIEATQLHLYKRRTELSFNFLSKAIPFLQEIKHNMSILLHASESYSGASFKEAENLETELTQAANTIGSNRGAVARYTSKYNAMAEKLREVHGTLGDVLLSDPHVGGATTAAMECGGVQRANAGSISYKVEQTLSSKEGCVWVIEAAMNTTARLGFRLRSPGFITTDNTFLSIGYFKNGQYDDSNSFVWHKFEAGSEPYDIVVDAQVAFVHFVSSPPQSGAFDDNRGFTLEFKAKSILGSTQSNIYTNEFIKGVSGTRKYPPLGMYRNNERTAFILQPTLPRTVLTINWWDLEDNDDSLSIWYFGSNFKWSRESKLSGRRSASSIRRFLPQGSRNDPFLLFFRSDSGTVYDGFEFELGTL